jgi:hypothetical protein
MHGTFVLNAAAAAEHRRDLREDGCLARRANLAARARRLARARARG